MASDRRFNSLVVAVFLLCGLALFLTFFDVVASPIRVLPELLAIGLLTGCICVLRRSERDVEAMARRVRKLAYEVQTTEETAHVCSGRIKVLKTQLGDSEQHMRALREHSRRRMRVSQAIVHLSNAHQLILLLQNGWTLSGGDGLVVFIRDAVNEVRTTLQQFRGSNWGLRKDEHTLLWNLAEDASRCLLKLQQTQPGAASGVRDIATVLDEIVTLLKSHRHDFLKWYQGELAALGGT
jgi:hypothetical protein